MQSSFRAMSLAFALVGTLVLSAGCTQGEGDRCETPSDCASGFVCRGVAHNGVCTRQSNPGSGGTGGSTGQDAAGPASTPDAASDEASITADAGGEGPFVAPDAATSVDVPVAADGAAGDTPLDGEAADTVLTD